MKDWLKILAQKKVELDKKKPLPQEIVKNLDDWLRVELTYTSNAIEGNTLSRQETALVVEKGITVEGKSILEHLEAINHAKTWDFVMKFRNETKKDVTERVIFDIHSLIMQG